MEVGGGRGGGEGGGGGEAGGQVGGGHKTPSVHLRSTQDLFHKSR